IVSGRYFLPKAPLLCLKWMPASAVTSVNSLGTEGRGGVGLGDGDAVTAISAGAWACGVTLAADLQPQIEATKQNRTNADRSFMQRATLGQQEFRAPLPCAAIRATTRRASRLDQRRTARKGERK